MPRISILIALIVALLFPLHPSAFASSTWYVNGVTGSDGNNCLSPKKACKTIGHAILLASSGDSILVAAATYTENLFISDSLRVIGASAKTTVIDGGSRGTVIIISNRDVRVTLANVTIQNGAVEYGGGGGINNFGTLTVINSIIRGNTATGKPGRGGGIYNTGTLTINRSTLSENVALGDFCFLHCVGAGGGGIDNEGVTLTVNDSTLSANTAQSKFGIGGGILNNSKALINNSTLSGNSAGEIGGGIESPSGSETMLTISNSTLSENTAGAGGAISSYLSPVILQNTIVANNKGGNCDGAMTSDGYNLSSDITCSFSGPGDMNDVNPMLGRLANNGGPTETQALLPGSPAIDAGNPNGCTDSNRKLLKTDQRGFLRPDKEDTGGCDIGAYEKQSD